MNQPSESIINVRFKLPSYEIHTLDIVFASGTFELTVRDLKWKLFQSGFAVDPRRIRLIQNMLELEDNKLLKDIALLGINIVEVVVKVVASENVRVHFKYDDFLQSVFPAHGAINVSTQVVISVEFKPNAASHVLFIPSLMSTDADIKPLYAADMISHFGGDREEAVRHGYQQWVGSDKDCVHQRMLLLEVDDTLELRLEALRYSADGPLNYEYNQGDRCSWQRYTTQPPIPCDLRGGFAREGDAVSTVTMTPCAPLRHDTQYAVLLCNGAPTVPLALQGADLYSFLPDGMCEDRLFLFRTQLPPPET